MTLSGATLQVRVDPGEMEMKEYSIFPKSPRAKLRPQVVFVIYQDTQ